MDMMMAEYAHGQFKIFYLFALRNYPDLELGSDLWGPYPITAARVPLPPKRFPCQPFPEYTLPPNLARLPDISVAFPAEAFSQVFQINLWSISHQPRQLILAGHASANTH